jgi:hypothetical protein
MGFAADSGSNGNTRLGWRIDFEADQKQIGL